MSATISELIPLALIVAVSPIPVLAVIVMLLTDRARANPLAYLCGWILTLTAIASLSALSGLDSIRTSPSKPFAIVLVVAGLVMLGLAVHEWRQRPRRGEPHKVEAWMRVLHTITPPRAFALGIFLVIVNVKDLLTTVQSGTVLAGDSLSLGQAAVAIAIFVLISSSTIIIPIAVAASFGHRSLPTLHRWRHWLERHGRLVAAGLFGLIALLLLAQGLSVLV
ncbi:MAG: hypothetical protein F2813_06255 [Actinobacteria bacterium]|uniref:Unannotated protein n=1 Tax=freshwater metagenome TaxID=449393 RepID=A0A6J5ZXH8_9ZZZZ|nr:hypothetical protein [Actinomycetota bacterium]